MFIYSTCDITHIINIWRSLYSSDTGHAGLPFVAAHGMIWVPPGYTFGAPMYGLDEVRGGSGFGAGTFAGATGTRQPSTVELEFAEHQVIIHFVLLWPVLQFPKGCVVAAVPL